MKAAALLLLRIGTGLLLISLGDRCASSRRARAGLAEKYNGGSSAWNGSNRFGAAEIVIGLSVVVGLFRRISFALAPKLLPRARVFDNL